MTCPECGQPLVQEEHRGIELDVCRNCYAMWFDQGELAAYWRESRAEGESPPVDPARFEADPDGTTLVCPRCASRTLAVRRVDVFRAGACSGCSGVWLSPAEVARPPGKLPPDRSDGLTLEALEAGVDLVLHVFGPFRKS